jgi:phage terminase small subunit
MTDRTGNTEGRPRKPAALKLLHGDDKQHPGRMNRREPIPSGQGTRAVVRPPMSPAAQAAWDRIAPDMIAQGVLTEWDVGLFTEWCESLILCKAARVRAVQELTGAIIVGPGQASPMAAYQRALLNSMALAARFGLTPVDRTRIMTPLEAQHGTKADLIS